MSYQKDRDEFVGVIVEEVATNNRGAIPQWARNQNAVDLARLILRNAATVQRLAIEHCNRQLRPGEEKQWEAAKARIVDACKPWGIRAKVNGDPRGCCVKLILPSGRWNSWGGKEDGYCVPTR
jgi:hypothetical protein